jgi:hypothetical protein
MKEYEGYRVTDRSKSQEALELIKLLGIFGMFID